MADDPPRRRGCGRILLGLIGLFLVALTAFLLALRPWSVPAPPPVPNPNGYDDFVAAGRAIVGEPKDINKPGAGPFTAYVAANAEPLRRVRVGLGRESRVPIRFTQAHLTRLMDEVQA